jgi:hypothetical protein
MDSPEDSLSIVGAAVVARFKTAIPQSGIKSNEKRLLR